MADVTYPVPAVHFSVDWGDGEGTFGFSEVSGLSAEQEPIEYRTGDDNALTVRKVPGLRKFGNVTLKRGIVPKASGFWKWWQQHDAGEERRRRPVLIKLLNEKHDAAVTWSLTNAQVVNVKGPDLNASGNEIAIESMELAHEGLQLVEP